MKLELNIPDEAIASTIVTAVEQSIGYWARNVGAVNRVTPRAKKLAEKHNLPDWAFAPLAGGWLSIDEYDETVAPDEDDPDVGVEQRFLFEECLLRRGLRRMVVTNPERFGRVVAGEADTEDADVFLQRCLFGEVRYG